MGRGSQNPPPFGQMGIAGIPAGTGAVEVPVLPTLIRRFADSLPARLRLRGCSFRRGGCFQAGRHHELRRRWCWHGGDETEVRPEP